MRRIGVALLFLLLSSVTATSVSAAASGRLSASSGCAPEHTRLAAADSEAQVYLVRRRVGAVAHGCALGHHRSYILQLREECTLPPPPQPPQSPFAGVFCYSSTVFALAGPIVAYADVSISGSSEPGAKTEETRNLLLVVRDLRNGRILHRVTTNQEGERSPFVFTANRPTGTFVIKRDGAVAWTDKAATAGASGVPNYEVHALDKSGTRLLAVGADIDPKSLALAGSTLYWTQSGKPMSATLD
jgi:hypothetical protein